MPGCSIRLPEEILALIVWHALAVGALDTSIGCTFPQARSELLFAQEERMSTKLALSLVSRTMHALCAPSLYETVSVYDPRRIYSLVATLRHDCPLSSRPHGYFCRRLDIDIVYNGPDWALGAASLWGLLLACPRLEVLTVSINAQMLDGASGATPVSGMFHCPLSLLIQIAELHGPHLRRLEFRGDICVYAGAVAFLSGPRCPRLEVLCVPGLFVSRDVPFGHPVNSADIPDSFVLMDQSHVDMAQLAMDSHTSELERALFLASHSKAVKWRSLCAADPLFPVLHTLDVGNFAKHVSRWRLPALSALHLSFREMLASADSVPAEETDAHTAVLSARGMHLTAVSYAGLRFEVCAHLDKLPNVSYLAFDAMRAPRAGLSIAHGRLAEVDLLASVGVYDTLWSWVDFILDTVERCELPELRVVRLMRTNRDVAQSPEFLEYHNAFAGVGIQLHAAPASDLLNVPHVFHIPAFLIQPPAPGETIQLERRAAPRREFVRAYVHFLAKLYPEIVGRMPTYRAWLRVINAAQHTAVPHPENHAA